MFNYRIIKFLVSCSKLTSKTVFMDVYVDDGVYTEDKDTKEEANMESGLSNLNVRFQKNNYY